MSLFVAFHYLFVKVIGCCLIGALLIGAVTLAEYIFLHLVEVLFQARDVAGALCEDRLVCAVCLVVDHAFARSGDVIAVSFDHGESIAVVVANAVCF